MGLLNGDSMTKSKLSFERVRDVDKIRAVNDYMKSKTAIPLFLFSAMLDNKGLLDKEGVEEVSRFCILKNFKVKHTTLVTWMMATRSILHQILLRF